MLNEISTPAVLFLHSSPRPQEITALKTEYLHELDGVRAASILLILATHLLPVGPSSWALNAMTGLMGMSLFFCLSGFLITRFLYVSLTFQTFMTRRIARIAPLLLLYGFLVAGLLMQRWDSFAGIVLLYFNYDDALIVKGLSHLWSICVEFHFYIAVALVILLLGRWGFWLVPVAAAIVLYLRIDAGAHANIRTHLRVDEILSGSLLALFWLHRTHPLAQPVLRIWRRAFWILLPLWLLSSHEIGGALNYLRPYLAMGIVGAILFMPEGVIRQLCRTGVLAYIAKISYALYIWHPMAALGWLNEGDRWTLYLIKRPITFALSFALAHLSTETLEKYFVSLARGTKTGSLRTATSGDPGHGVRWVHPLGSMILFLGVILLTFFMISL